MSWKIYKVTNSKSPYTIKLEKNQKLVMIHKYSDGVNFKANDEAQESLSMAAYSLYMYLIKHSNERLWALSCVDVVNKKLFGRSTYHAAVNELIEKKYLATGCIDIGTEYIAENSYHFYESPSLNPKCDNRRIAASNEIF